MKHVDLSLSVQKLCAEHPELKDVLYNLGFTEITKPGMLATVGRFMTIPKGAAMKKIDMEKVLQALKESGFEITGQQEETLAE